MELQKEFILWKYKSSQGIERQKNYKRVNPKHLIFV